MIHDISRELLLRSIQGDMTAFEEVYRATSGFVYSVALRILHNNADAEEVTQDVFVKVYRGLNNFRFKSSFRTWVYRIAVTTALNRYRSSKAEACHLADFIAQEPPVPSGRATPEELDRHDAEGRMMALLETLNPDQKACIVLREIEGLSYQEIAGILRVPVNTVRSRLKRSREALLAFRRKEGRDHEM